MKTVNKVLNALYNCLDIVFSILYPNRCVGCKEIVDNDLYLCTDCEKIEYVEYFPTIKYKNIRW